MLLGQVNIFMTFDVCFLRPRATFEVRAAPLIPRPAGESTGRACPLIGPTALSAPLPPR